MSARAAGEERVQRRPRQAARPSAKWLDGWTVLGVVCTVLGLWLLPTLSITRFREIAGDIALLLIGLFALGVAANSRWDLNQLWRTRRREASEEASAAVEKWRCTMSADQVMQALF